MGGLLRVVVVKNTDENVEKYSALKNVLIAILSVTSAFGPRLVARQLTKLVKEVGQRLPPFALEKCLGLRLMPKVLKELLEVIPESS